MKKLLLVLLIFIIAEKNYCQEKPTQKNENVNRDVKDGSTNTYEIIYDFRTGEYVKNNLRIKVNTPTVFKIININRLAYDIKIISKDTLLAETFITDEQTESNVDALSKKKESVFINTSSGVITNPQKLDISSLDPNQDFIVDKSKSFVTAKEKIFFDLKKIPVINKLEKEKLIYQNELELLKSKKSALEANLQDLTKIEVSIKKVNEDLEKINQDIRLVDSKSLVAEDKIAEKERLTSLETAAHQKKSELEEALTKIDTAKLREEIEKENENITKKTNEIKLIDDSLKENTKDFKDIVKKYNDDNLALQEAFNKLNLSYQEILKLTDQYIKIKTICDYPYLTKDKYEKEYKTKITAEAELILQQRQIATSFKENYNQIGIRYSNLKYNPYLAEYLNYGGQTKLFAQADYIKELADKINNDVVGINIAVLFQKIEHLLQLLENDNTYSYVSAPIQPTQDAAIFEISIKKKEGNHSDITDEKTFKHTEFTYGGTRIDYSIGLAASYFWNANVYEFGVQKDPITGEEYTVLSKKEKHLTVPSMVGLITMSYRKTRYIAYGGSAGLGIDVVNGRIQLSNFFIGPTILFGKYDRLFLTGGLSFRNVGKLKSGYNTQERLNSGTDDINNFITEKYKIGVFMSLTYNLTKGVRANYKRLNK
uniref:hypothetical protein n=3 Tax=Flavobacterium sp. TaxID=239 RepID=UPI00404B9571